MRPQLKLLAAACALALAALPVAAALATGPVYEVEHPAHPTHPTHPQHPDHPPKPGDTPGAKAKAYGRYCQGESKKHLAGTKGTPFSQCVTGMAKLANGVTTSPAKACAGLSKKHVDGTPGTPFSICVKGGKKLLAE